MNRIVKELIMQPKYGYMHGYTEEQISEILNIYKKKNKNINHEISKKEQRRRKKFRNSVL